MFYTYIHKTADTNEVFYVGKGKDNRAYITKRNAFWKNVANKHGFTVEILSEFENESDAFQEEKTLIAKFRADGARLVNLTDGGEGHSGYVQTEETKEKRAKKLRGKKRSAETVDKVRKANLGKKRSDSYKAMLSEKYKGIAPMHATIKAIEANTGKPCKDSTKQKISAANTGKKRTEAMVEAMSVAVKCVETNQIFYGMNAAKNFLRANGFPKANHSAISMVCSGKLKTAYGYHWEKI